MRRVAAAILGAILASCGASDSDVEIDPTFTEVRRHEIERAQHTWSGVATRQIFIVGKNEGEWLVLPASVERGLRGNTGYHHRIIRISPETPDDQVYAVALHEFGHVLGLSHVTRGVMDPDRVTTEFSDEDFAECRRVEACL